MGQITGVPQTEHIFCFRNAVSALASGAYRIVSDTLVSYLM